MHPTLRVYRGELEQFTNEPDQEVRVRLGDVLPVLHEAILARRRWVSDFADDEVQLPSDLYEILVAYMHLRPGA